VIAALLTTPDGRYIVVRGRLWRAANPHLPEAQRQALVNRLMAARRAVAAGRRGADREAVAAARAEVDAAKVALGERGPVWWADGAPDLNRRLARDTCYGAWYASAAEPIPQPTGSGSRSPGSATPRTPPKPGTAP
jgi:hypothetical protein